MFLEHHETHDSNYKIYTEGSKSNEGVGLAVVADDFCEAAELFPFDSIYNAELSAITEAINVAYHSNKKILCYNSSHSLAQKAH